MRVRRKSHAGEEERGPLFVQARKKLGSFGTAAPPDKVAIESPLRHEAKYSSRNRRRAFTGINTIPKKNLLYHPNGERINFVIHLHVEQVLAHSYLDFRGAN